MNEREYVHIASLLRSCLELNGSVPVERPYYWGVATALVNAGQARWLGPVRNGTYRVLGALPCRV